MSSSPEMAARRTALLTGLALTGFAANSLLCRAALGAHAIDAPSFTAVRLASGALVLALVARIARPRPADSTGPRASAPGERPAAMAARGGALFVYAAAFSFAYLRLGAGTGALVLFATVQATMIGWSALRGTRPTAIETAGLAVALAGLVVLVRPGLA